MNTVYKVIWSHTANAFVVASEIAAGKGKTGTNRKVSRTATTLCLALSTAMLAGPAGAVVVNGGSLTNPGVAASDGGSSTNVALGSGAKVDSTSVGAIAFGANSSITQGDQAIAIGYGANVTGGAGTYGGIAIGYEATAAKIESVALGSRTSAIGGNSIAIGNQVRAEAGQSIAISGNLDSSVASGKSLAVDSTSTGGIAVGTEAQIKQSTYGIALGYGSSVSSASGGVAIGRGASVSAVNSLALGSSANASGTASIAMGAGATASGINSISIGVGNVVTGARSGAIGDPSTINASDSYSVGNNNTIAVGQSDVFVLGNNVTATASNSVVLGSASAASAALTGSSAGTSVYATGSLGGNTYQYAGTTPTGVVSVGDVGAERRIQNVGAGLIGSSSTDAINGSQLYATNQAIEGLTSTIDGVGDQAVKSDLNADGTINYNSVTMGGTVYNSTTKTGGTTITNVARGVGDSDAVNMSQLNETNVRVGAAEDDIADLAGTVNNFAGNQSATYTTQNGRGIRYVRTNDAGLTLADASAQGVGSTAVGYEAIAEGVGSLALGRGAAATQDGSVALGAGSVTAAAVATTGVTLNGQAYTFAGTAPMSTVSVGAAGTERTLTNVAAGRISGTSTDAINGSQLYATNQAIEGLTSTIDGVGDQAVKSDLNADGTINYNSVTMGGTVYNSTTKTGGTTITNVARGVGDSDAVNMSQLNETNVRVGAAEDDIADLAGTVNNFAGNQSATYTTQNGRGIRYVRTNDAGLTLADASAQGVGSTAVGYEAIAEGVGSLALGRGAAATQDGSVALGAGSVTAAAVATTGVTLNGQAYTFAGTAPMSTVSVGAAGTERTLTNVAAGRISGTSTDAINGSQLYATNQTIEGLTSNIDGLGDQAVKYDLNADGTVNYNGVTMGAAASTDGGKTGGTRITNVAQGTISENSTDAVNGAQLYMIVGDTSSNYVTLNGSGFRYARTNDAGLVKADAYASGYGSTALGYAATSTGTNSVAVGRDAVASQDDSVALGAGSVTGAAVATTGTTLNGQAYAFAGTAPTSTVSVGDVGAERTITNVAAGRISDTSTDAVNGSQLHATNQAIEGLDDRVTNMEGNVSGFDGRIDTIAGDVGNLATEVQEQDNRLTVVEGDVNHIKNGAAGIFQVGQGGTVTPPSVTGSNSVAGGNGAQASGNNALALGNQASASGQNSTAIGQGAQATHDNSVAIGAGSATTVGKQSGYDAAYVGASSSTGEMNVGGRTITGLAPGISGTDAVNLNQLNAGVSHAVSEANAYTDSRVSKVEGDVWDMNRSYRGATASAMAMAGLPQAYLPGKSMLAVGMGGYQGEYSMAVGLSGITDSGRWVYKAQASGNTTREVGFSVGAGIQW